MDFKKGIPLDSTVYILVEMESSDGKKFNIKAKLFKDDIVYSTAHSLFITVKL